jgi:sugar phosphate isomerase/epimerase
MAKQRKVSRRTFIGAAAGAAGATALSPLGPSLSLGHDKDKHKGDRLVPRDRLGLQQFAIRDSITRLDKSVMGNLGGPSFPDNAADIGPTVALPGGFAAVFEYLASVRYTGFEFFSFNNGANPPLTTAQIRTALDNAGLKAAGTHTGGLAAMSDPVNGAANRQTQIDMAGILGYKMIGTAGNPANPTLGTLAAWQGYAEAANMVGAAFRAAGIKYFFHPEQDWFRFFDDPAHPELARVHRIDWFTDNTDRKLVYFEPDTMHTLAGRARFPDPVDGRLFDVNAWYGRLAAQKRLIAWHAKDADRIIPLPAAGTNPFTQQRARPGFPLNGGIDVVYVGEGSIANGYPVDPDPEVIGYQEQFDRFELSSPGWFHAESDSGPGPAATDPGRSLRWAKVSAKYLLALRADEDDNCDDDDDHHHHHHHHHGHGH